MNLAAPEFTGTSRGALVSALKQVGRDGELTVCSPRGTVRSMFELTRLHRVISIVEMPSGNAQTPASDLLSPA